MLAAGCSCIERFGNDWLSGGRVYIVSSRFYLHTILASFVYAIGGVFATCVMYAFETDLSPFCAMIW